MYPVVQVILVVAGVVSMAMLVYIAWSGYRRDRKVRLSSVYAALVQQDNIVNSEIGEYGIGGPYAALLNIPKNEYQEFGHHATVFFHQLRLLSIVYQSGINQRLLIMKDVERYTAWAKTVLKPWINSNKYLDALLDKVIMQEDLYGKNFLTWFKMLMK